ncbi:hypothetical protein FPZ42_15845 [Mucilaginibacter achroorhodeus]|uniref:Lipocalin-like domain-containing protein n=1 Tax=Mucilaginibacter achroorhodeus TaxID=2599294 RepID=A0A563U1Z6_9SPHI|nr:hypothetical protein [Mucilaginibacter achroorhodeus]TWR24569.1 hypothetical protein FPZ42_15845 [Mucilaginibacter achroorhodeus]
MIKKMRYPLIASLVVMCILINSCKRDNTDNISTLLTTGYWQLGSLTQLDYIGDTQLGDTTYVCDTVQTFTFNKDGSCNFVNFACATNTANGTWNLSDTRLFLNANITEPDSTGKPYQPFANSRIANLGEYSLVLETGDIQNYYSTTDRRRIFRWGFVRRRTSTK